MSDDEEFKFKDDFMDLHADKPEVDPVQLAAIQQENFLFQQCFNSPAGKRVLATLKQQYYDDLAPLDPSQYGRFLGRRDVVQFILTNLEGMGSDG